MDVGRLITILMYVLNVFFIFFLVFISKKETRSILVWIMVSALLPGLSIILYILIGQDFRKSKMFSLKEEQDKILRAIVDEQSVALSRDELFLKNRKNFDYKKMINLNLNSDDAIFTQDNEIDVFFWGKDKFDSLLKDLENAKESIDIQYYIFKYDKIGKKVFDLLEKKVEEGIKVRLLVDGIGGRFLRKKGFHRDSFEKKGGEFAIFFPSFMNINLRLNYRNHRKIVIIDDKIGYIGGFNIGDDYMGRYKKFGPWRDTHIRIRGNAIYGLKSRFIKDWYYAKDEDIQKEPNIPYVENTKGHVGVQILTSGPDTEQENIKNAMLEMITQAKERIVIQTPYFIPDESMVDGLTNALLSGVEVDIMIPNKPDHPLVYWATTSYAGDLLKLGANIYIYNKGFLHCKVINVDDYLTLVGSANFDNRSFLLNFEANALIYDRDITRKFLDQFEVDIEDSILMDEKMYENRPLGQRIKEPISRLFSPLL